jgi:hypothetical protein
MQNLKKYSNGFPLKLEKQNRKFLPYNPLVFTLAIFLIDFVLLLKKHKLDFKSEKRLGVKDFPQNRIPMSKK